MLEKYETPTAPAEPTVKPIIEPWILPAEPEKPDVPEPIIPDAVPTTDPRELPAPCPCTCPW